MENSPALWWNWDCETRPPSLDKEHSVRKWLVCHVQQMNTYMLFSNTSRSGCAAAHIPEGAEDVHSASLPPRPPLILARYDRTSIFELFQEAQRARSVASGLYYRVWLDS